MDRLAGVREAWIAGGQTEVAPQPPMDRPIARHRSGEFPIVRSQQRLDKNRWHWLLLVPIVLPLMPVLYNRIEPTLFGMPFFYWCQLGFAFLASAVITLVHRKVR